MKKNNSNIIIILLIVLAGGLLTYFAFNDDDAKTYVWYESYRASSDQPYGTLFIKKLLESYREDFTLNDKSSLKKLFSLEKFKDNTTYVVIGESIYLDNNDILALGEFLQNGNDVFISTTDVPHKILGSLYSSECGTTITYEANSGHDVHLNFYHDTLRRESPFAFAYRFKDMDRPYPWDYFTRELFCDSAKKLTPLGYQAIDQVNFLKVAVGDGNLYLHSNPLVFTNYFVTRRWNLDYYTGVFSHMKGDNIIWDEYSKLPSMRKDNPYSSPLYYILSQPSLKYAWWLLLLSVALYIFFAAKRKQKIIPVLEPKTNTSLEFVNLISSLHYNNGNHVDMARKKMKYFLYFIRSRYGIHAEKFKPEHIKKLSDKSKVDILQVQSIFDQYALIEEKFRDHIEANRMINLYYSIENFYKHCK